MKRILVLCVANKFSWLFPKSRALHRREILLTRLQRHPFFSLNFGFNYSPLDISGYTHMLKFHRFPTRDEWLMFEAIRDGPKRTSFKATKNPIAVYPQSIWNIVDQRPCLLLLLVIVSGECLFTEEEEQ